MTGIEKVLVALGVLGAGVGVGVLVSKASTPSPAPAPTSSPGSPAPGGGGSTTPATSGLWLRATTLNPNDRVRVSVALSDLQTLAQSLGLQTTTTGNVDPNTLFGSIWQQVLASTQVQSVLQAQGLQAWWPVTPTATSPSAMAPSPLPTDWPPDDTSASAEYHAQFTYGGTTPLAVASLPIPVLAWTAKGTGA